MHKLYILGSNASVYKLKKHIIKKVFSDHEIIELRHFELDKIEKYSRVIILAYSRRFKANKKIADYMVQNHNRCFYFLSASSLSLFCLSFSYSRSKRQQLLYLMQNSSDNAYLAIFGSFDKIEREGKLALTNDYIFEKSCMDYLHGRCGVFNLFQIEKKDTIKNSMHYYFIYLFMGIIIGSFILKNATNYTYGYNDATFYKLGIEHSVKCTNILYLLTSVFLFCPPLIIGSIYFFITN